MKMQYFLEKYKVLDKLPLHGSSLAGPSANTHLVQSKDT